MTKRILQQFDSVYSTVHNFQEERLGDLKNSCLLCEKKRESALFSVQSCQKNMNKSGEILKIHAYIYSEGYIVDLQRSRVRIGETYFVDGYFKVQKQLALWTGLLFNNTYMSNFLPRSGYLPVIY